MTQKVIGTLICMTVIFALATIASAQSQKLIANIPFDFNVGSVELAAGSYMVDVTNSGVLELMDAKGKMIFSSSRPASQPKSQTQNALLFKRYGDAYFLSQLFWEGGLARELPKTGKEIELARRYQAVPTVKTAEAR